MSMNESSISSGKSYILEQNYLALRDQFIIDIAHLFNIEYSVLRNMLANVLPSDVDVQAPTDVPTESVAVTGSTSDGYHTFDELYAHRAALTACLLKSYSNRYAHLITNYMWRSTKHHPDNGPMYPGMFIVGFTLPTGTVTYHYKLEEWNLFHFVPTREYAPIWDGLTPTNTLIMLRNWAKSS